jgi:hypothetical protein
MHHCSALMHMLALVAFLNKAAAASGPPLGPVKAGHNAAPNAFTDQLINRCDVHYHDTILDHFDWVSRNVWKQETTLYAMVVHVLDAPLTMRQN